MPFYFLLFLFAFTDEPKLAIAICLLNSLVDKQRDVERDVEQYDDDDEPASLNPAIHIPNPWREAVEWVGCQQDHELVDQLLSIEEQGFVGTRSP